MQVIRPEGSKAALGAASLLNPESIEVRHIDSWNWAGRPRFLLRDRILVFYVGGDAATDATLRSVLCRPFAESREHLGGFWVIQSADLDEALECSRQASVACANPVEVRPFQSDV